MKKITFLAFHLLLLFVLTLKAQTPRAGGFVYGWEQYDNSNLNGLGEAVVIFDTTGLRPLIHAPTIGVHPRIFFGPEELPDLRWRLANTESGQAVMTQIHAFTTLLNLGAADYNHNSSYGLDSDGNRWVDNTGFWDSKIYYDRLASEDPAVWEGIEIKRKHITACLLALEAFECLIFQGEEDTDTGLTYAERSEKLARAMAFWANLALDDPAVNPDNNNFNHFGGTHMALAYDLNYHAMTIPQRDLVREAIAKITPNEPRHGAHLPAFANQSNWSALNSFEIMTNMAIEGEEGYRPELTERWMRAYHNFITYGWYPSGAGYEGLGKNYQFVTTMIAAAKRGYSLLGHPHVRAYATQFLPAITQPFGHGFTSYDVWGGSGHDAVTGGYKFSPSDAVGLKWAFPDNASIDYVWRNYIERSYNSTSQGYVYQQIRPDDSYYNYLIPAAVFCQDYESTTQASTPYSTDYFASDRGLAVFKTLADSNALAVQFHCRQDLGGHTHGDRNDFTLSALGRVWVRKSYGGSQFQPTGFHSSILIDGRGVGVGDPDGDKCRQPGTILDYQSDENKSIVSGDATYAYTWEWHWSPQSLADDHPWLGSNGWEPVTATWNDFQYEPQVAAHYDIPFYEYPHWHQADRYERMVKRLYNPMEKVFRTLALVRSEQPYVLIIDDLKKDEEEHHYQWLGQLARDLTIESTDVNLDSEDYRCDVILKEPEVTGNRRLLVRVLENTGYDGDTAPALMDTLTYFDYFSGNPYNSNPNYVRPRLIIESTSVTPEFKVLLLPFTVGDELPVTQWNMTRDTLSVIQAGVSQRIAFPKNEQERTEIVWVEDIINNQGEASITAKVQVFPNPAAHYVYIQQSEASNANTINVYTHQGHLVVQETLKRESTTINVRQLPSGTYTYILSDKSGQSLQQGKLIIQK